MGFNLEVWDLAVVKHALKIAKKEYESDLEYLQQHKVKGIDNKKAIEMSVSMLTDIKEVLAKLEK